MIQRRVVDILLGVYIALLVVPAAIIAGGGAIVDSPLAVAAASVGIAVVGALAARSVDDLVDQLLSAPVVVGVFCLPLVYVPYLIFATEPRSTAALIAVVGCAALVPGSVSLFVGIYLRIRRFREQSTEIVAVTVGNPGNSTLKQIGPIAVAVGGITMIGASAWSFFTGDDGFVTPASLGGLLALMLLVGDDGTELTVTDIGLYVDQPVIFWEDLDGYRLTDDSLALVRSEWYLPDWQFDREEISDEKALLDGLREFLPRLDEHGRVELSPRQPTR